MQKVYDQLIKGLKEYFKNSGCERAVMGVSGGIDSSLTLKLAVDALGAENVTAILMPEIGITNDENMMHAQRLCEFFGAKHFRVPINKFLIDYGFLPWGASDAAKLNVKARVRMVILYHYANTENALVLGTSNKSEIMLGYGTKFGDFAADIELLGDLLKEDVYALAEHLGMPEEIIHKAPTAELKSGQTDESDLGAPYHLLDQILKQVDLGKNELISKGMDATLVNNVFMRIAANAHKSHPTHVIPAWKEKAAAPKEKILIADEMPQMPEEPVEIKKIKQRKPKGLQRVPVEEKETIAASAEEDPRDQATLF